MMKSREHIVTNGRAAFYATIWPDLRDAALDCGWALGLHGSLASDMDLMAMPWTESAKPVDDMIESITKCFTDNPFCKPTVTTNKPNDRVVYTISIWADFHLDINIISKTKVSDIVCPFCGEDGFDKIGLKDHLLINCKPYKTTSPIWMTDISETKPPTE